MSVWFVSPLDFPHPPKLVIKGADTCLVFSFNTAEAVERVLYHGGFKEEFMAASSTAGSLVIQRRFSTTEVTVIFSNHPERVP